MLSKDMPLKAKLAVSVNDLDLSVRVWNALKSDCIKTVSDLVHQTEHDLLRIPNFGVRSLKEVEDVLAEGGLHLGMSNVLECNEALTKDFLTSCKYGLETFVEIFLRKGARVDCIDEDGKTPLLLAMESGNENVVRLIVKACG